jgi:hypothetical protein
MKRIDDQTREAILELAEEIEDEGWAVSRRASAREFGVSPQTVARVLDGPLARRAKPAVERDGQGRAAALWLAALAGVIIAALWKRRR